MPVTSVAQFWEKYEVWLSENGLATEHWLPAGATEAAIAEAEATFGFQLPQELKEFYCLHDGCGFWPAEEGCCSLESALYIAQMRREIVRKTAAQYPESANDLWWVDDWFPFVEDGGGNGDAVQCGGEELGCMAYFDHETGGSRTGQAFLDYLNAALNDLSFYVSDPEDGPIPREELPEDHPEYFEGDIYDWRAHLEGRSRFGDEEEDE